jgi:predicted metal-dependent enzyme (double-stranded beta helix superfamily)
MTTVKYTLDQFVHDMEDLLKSQPDSEKIFDIGSGWLEKLTRNIDNIPEEYRRPLGAGARPNHGSYLLYQGESGLQVTTVVWGPGEHLGPHDHHTWGIIGVLDNTLTETRYQRVDDRSREGFAKLERDRTAQFKPGEITLLVPDVDEIHQMDNHTGRPTVEVHVYGTDLRGLQRCRYNLETGEIITFATPKWDNC